MSYLYWAIHKYNLVIMRVVGVLRLVEWFTHNYRTENRDMIRLSLTKTESVL